MGAHFYLTLLLIPTTLTIPNRQRGQWIKVGSKSSIAF
jgi:hypothetical protein